MANMMLAMPVLSDGVDLFTSTTAGSLPKTNLQTSPIGQVCRFTTPSAVFIEPQISGGINLVALLGHNGSVTGKVRVRGATSKDNLLTDPDYDSGYVPLRSNQATYDGSDVAGALDTNHFIHVLPELKDYPFWRIDIEDSSLSYLDVGRLYLAHAWQPATNMEYGVTEGFIDPSSVARMVSGRQAALRRPIYRFTEFRLGFCSEQEIFDFAFEFDRKRGATKDVLFIFDHENKPLIQKRTIYGTMSGLAPIIHPHFRLFEKSYRIEEIVK